MSTCRIAMLESNTGRQDTVAHTSNLNTQATEAG